MKKSALIAVLGMLLISNAMAATEQLKQNAIDTGLAWLASTQNQSGAEGWWPYPWEGTLAATSARGRDSRHRLSHDRPQGMG